MKWIVPGCGPSSGVARSNRNSERDVCGINMRKPAPTSCRNGIDRSESPAPPFVTIVSDIEFGGRVPYVGVKNYAAGRCAGFLMSRFLRGLSAPAIAVVAGSAMYRAHQHREMGFRDSMRESLPDSNLVAITDVRNDGNNSFREISELLRERRDIAGVYNVGAGNRGIVRALRERGADVAKPLFVAHELTPHSRTGVHEGLVDAIVGQDPHLLADTAIRTLLQMESQPIGEADRNISIPSIYIRENLL